jgi:hypothetical protein
VAGDLRILEAAQQTDSAILLQLLNFLLLIAPWLREASLEAFFAARPAYGPVSERVEEVRSWAREHEGEVANSPVARALREADVRFIWELLAAALWLVYRYEMRRDQHPLLYDL